MNIRLLGLVATVTLLSAASGCCGVKNLMFGRGARCGLCQRTSSPLAAPAPPYAPQVPCRTQPYAPPAPYTPPVAHPPAAYAPSPCTPAAPTCTQPIVTAPTTGCGCNGYACGGEVAYGSSYCGECQCGIHGGVVHDPYLSSGTVVPYDGQIVGETVLDGEVYGGTVYPGTSYPGTGTPIGEGPWTPRVESQKVDADGNKILWEEPLPPGATAK